MSDNTIDFQEEMSKAELIKDESPSFTGVLQKSKKEFYYYPEEPVSYDGHKVDYFHFKKPNLRKCKANNVILGENMSARDMESLVRASMLRIAKKDGGEFMSCHFKDIIEELEIDEVVQMTNGCSGFFVKGAE